MTKVDIISGFLGAGKTTFIKTLIEKVWTDEKIVLIENEFGEIGIDSRFMRDSGLRVAEMNSGCICCTLSGDFAKSLKQAVEAWEPDRILIEPSGVGKLSEVTEAVLSVREEAQLEIGSRITVVDGKKAAMYLKNFNEFFKDQLRHADTLVISRTQMMDEDKLKDCVDMLREYNGEAAVITTPWEKLDGRTILDAIQHGQEPGAELMREHGHHDHDEHHEDCGRHDHHNHHHHHEHHHHDHHERHHADEVFESWGIQTVHKFNRAELEDVLKMLSMTEEFGAVLRAKGIVEGSDGQWMEFDMVPQEAEIRSCPADYTGRVCVIGTELNTEYLNQVFGK